VIKLRYTSSGQPISDFDLEVAFERLKQCASLDSEHEFFFSTENIFLRVRVAVKESEIPHGEVLFCYDTKRILLDENGSMNQCPDGFIDTTEKLLLRLI